MLCFSRGMPSRALACLLLASIPHHAQEPVPSEPKPSAVEIAQSRLFESLTRRDLTEIEERALGVLALVQRGSDPWFHARAAQGLVRYMRWEKDELAQVVRDTIRAFNERSAQPPEGSLPISPLARTDVLRVQGLAAALNQSNGFHDSALQLLYVSLSALEQEPAYGGPELLPNTLLSAARSLMAVGRGHEATLLLERLRDGFSNCFQGAQATVLLENGRERLAAYRGKYEGDSRHGARMEALFALIPTTEEELAEALALEVEELPGVYVGVADHVPELGLVNAVTSVDARLPAFPPIVVFVSEHLALDCRDPHETLIHELVHAVLALRCGLSYERAPPWLTEGLSQAIAGQFDSNAQAWLESALFEHPPAFVADDFWKRTTFSFDPGKQTGLHRMETGFAILLLLEKSGRAGLLQVVDGLRSGHSAADAVRSATGLGETEYLAAAKDVAVRFLEERRAPSLPLLRSLIASGKRASAGELTPDDVLEALEKACAADTPKLARAFALWQRAELLEGLGRYPEAEAAFRYLYEERRRHPSSVELAVIGRARCLQKMGAAAEAEQLLADLERDLVTEGARGQLAKLRGK